MISVAEQTMWVDWQHRQGATWDSSAKACKVRVWGDLKPLSVERYYQVSPRKELWEVYLPSYWDWPMLMTSPVQSVNNKLMSSMSGLRNFWSNLRKFASNSKQRRQWMIRFCFISQGAWGILFWCHTWNEPEQVLGIRWNMAEDWFVQLPWGCRSSPEIGPYQKKCRQCDCQVLWWPLRFPASCKHFVKRRWRGMMCSPENCYCSGTILVNSPQLQISENTLSYAPRGCITVSICCCHLSKDPGGTYRKKFVAAKSQVSPLKKLLIPRLWLP